MNSKRHEHDLPEQLLRRFRAIDPEGGRPSRSVEHSEAKAALFEKITTTTAPTDLRSARRRSFPRPSTWFDRPALAVPAIVAVIAAIGAGLLIVGSAGAPSPASAAIAAAKASGEPSSGQAITVVVVETVGDGPEQAGSRTTIDYRFDEDDYQVDFLSILTEGGEQIGFSERLVDGTRYLSQTPDAWIAAEDDGELDSRDLFGFSTGSADPDTVVELIELAPDLAEVAGDESTGQAVTVYSGTIAADDLVASGGDLPLGMQLLVTGDDPRAELPDRLELRVSVADGLLTEVEVGINGDVPAGYLIDATFTTTYLGFGESQGIEAPSPDQLVESLDLDFPVMEPSTDAALEAMNDLEQRRPGLCADVIEEGPVMNFEAPTDEMLAELETMMAELDTCLREAGEAETADLIAESGLFDPPVDG